MVPYLKIVETQSYSLKIAFPFVPRILNRHGKESFRIYADLTLFLESESSASLQKNRGQFPLRNVVKIYCVQNNLAKIKLWKIGLLQKLSLNINYLQRDWTILMTRCIRVYSTFKFQIVYWLKSL